MSVARTRKQTWHLWATRYLLSVAILVSAGLPVTVSADAELMLFPTRVVFEGNRRSVQIDLVNRGDAPGTYRIAFQQKKMDNLGRFSVIAQDEAGHHFADKMIRYSPRQVVLGPGGSQAVRLLLRKPADLEPGEYRSHLLFERIPDAEDNDFEAELDDNSQDGLTIELKALVSVSIPVIVRQGTTNADVTLSAPQFDPAFGETGLLSFDIGRTGNRSVYGDVVASFAPAGRDEEVVVAEGKGVAVYRPNERRLLRLALLAGMREQLQGGGELRVRYFARPDEGGDLISEVAQQLPPQG